MNMFRLKISAFVLAFTLLFSLCSAAPTPPSSHVNKEVKHSDNEVHHNSSGIHADEDVLTDDEQMEADLQDINEADEQPTSGNDGDSEESTLIIDNQVQTQTIVVVPEPIGFNGDGDAAEEGLMETNAQTFNTVNHVTDQTIVVVQPVGAVDVGEDLSDMFETFNIDNQAENQTIFIVQQPPENQSNGQEEAFFRADNEEAEVNCTARATCFSNSDCGKGRCLGAFVGKCNCNACISGKACADDSDCGGYQHGCDTVKGRCNCIKAHSENGFASFGHALTDFCNHRVCSGGNASTACLGLPCHVGHCAC